MSIARKRSRAPRKAAADTDSPLEKRAERLGYDLPDVPDEVVLEDNTPKLVTADKGSPIAKRAKRLGYDLPESPETVISETAISVPLGGDEN